MSRVCVFCGQRDQGLTLEHVYPDWLSSLFSKDIKGTNEVSSDTTASRVWQGRLFQHKVKLVCAVCNNGWMSGLEGGAKDLIKSLAFTHDTQALSEEDQRRVSLWVQKTVLMNNKANGSDGFQIPSDFFTDLYNTKQPLPNVMVSMGWRMLANGTKEQPLASFEIKQVAGVQVDKESEDAIMSQVDNGALIWTAVLALGNMVFHVVGSNIDGRLEVGSSDHRMFSQINPFEEVLEWPIEWPIEAVGGLDAVKKGM